jgi:hypothetical protein
MMLTEAVIAPGRFDALMKFDMYPGQREYGEYVLQKDALDPKIQRRLSTMRSRNYAGWKSERRDAATS